MLLLSYPNVPDVAQTTVTTTDQEPALTAEQRLAALEHELADLRARLDLERSERDAREQALLAEIDHLSKPAGQPIDADAWYRRLKVGGYGELNFVDEANTSRTVDLERFVIYMGYDFTEGIHLHSETEIEHGLVAPDGDGELELEQLYVDFDLGDNAGIRAGRFLTPIGILNQHHEPTTFHGVLRSDFDTFILPSTWSADGIGIFGRPLENVSGELYVQSGLDGTGFDAVDGIREGRQEQFAGLSHPGVSGRLDWFPGIGAGRSLRVGASAFGSGLNNGANDVNNGLDGDIRIYAADTQLSVGRLDFKGVYAFEKISHAEQIGNNVASEIDGWLVEGALHVLPDSWKVGKRADADATVYVRYENLDTQKEMPAGVTADPAGKRNIWTFGVDYLPTRHFVVKADYQIRDDEAGGLPERIALGMGWSF